MLEGRHRVTCGSAGCRDRRFRRLHPESYQERERQKVARRRARRAELRTLAGERDADGRGHSSSLPKKTGAPLADGSA